MKKITLILLSLLFVFLIGCKNEEINPYIEEKDTYTIEHNDLIIYIQNLNSKFDNEFIVSQTTNDSIEFETKTTAKGYALITYSLMDFNEDYINQMKEQIQTAMLTYKSIEEYYDIDKLEVSNVLTRENDFGLLNYQYIFVPLLSSNNITYSYVAWQQIDNQLLLINSGGLAPLDFFTLVPEYLLVSSTPLSNDIWMYMKNNNK